MEFTVKKYMLIGAATMAIVKPRSLNMTLLSSVSACNCNATPHSRCIKHTQEPQVSHQSWMVSPLLQMRQRSGLEDSDWPCWIVDVAVVVLLL